MTAQDETPHVHLYCINKQKACNLPATTPATVFVNTQLCNVLYFFCIYSQDKPLLEELQLETMVLAVADTATCLEHWSS